MKKLLQTLAVAIIVLGSAVGVAYAAGLTVPQGGTGWTGWVAGTIPIGPGTGPTALRFATSSALTFATSSSNLTFTNGSSTAFTATNLYSSNSTTTGSSFGAYGLFSNLIVGTSTASTTIYGNSTSTFAGGVNIPSGSGCFAIGGTCLAQTSGTVTSVAASVPSVLSISGSPITTSGTLTIGYSGTALPIANGGTAATSFTTTGNGVYYTGSVLATAPTTASVTYPFASSTAISATGNIYAGTTSGTISVSSSTPFATLAVNPIAGAASAQFAIGSSTATNFIVTNAGNVGIGTTSPQARLTLDRQQGVASSSIIVTQYNPATSTSMTIDCKDSNTIGVPIGTAAVTLILASMVGGQNCFVAVTNPNGTGGAITWVAPSGEKLLWTGGTVPTQTTTANKGDGWSFKAIQYLATATTTPGTVIWGAMTPNF